MIFGSRLRQRFLEISFGVTSTILSLISLMSGAFLLLIYEWTQQRREPESLKGQFKDPDWIRLCCSGCLQHANHFVFIQFDLIHVSFSVFAFIMIHSNGSRAGSESRFGPFSWVNVLV